MMTRKVFFLRTWFLVFISGLLLFAITDFALVMTANPNYLPTVILIGAFLVPVTFVAYTYQKAPIGEIPLPAVTITFLWGGVLGTILAGILEYQTLRQAQWFSLLGVGFIEEAAKLVVPVIIFIMGRYRHEADGLLFGITAGMGFAALETMGYGFVNFIQSQGDLGILHQTLLVRGLMSPANHAAWTGIVCAALWRQREKTGRPVVNLPVLGAFLLAVILHAAWDTFGSISRVFGNHYAYVDIIGLAIIGGISLCLLIIRLVKAPHRSRPAVVPETPVSPGP